MTVEAPTTDLRHRLRRAAPTPRLRAAEDRKLTLVALYALLFVVLSGLYYTYTSLVWSYIGLTLRPDAFKMVFSAIVLIGFVAATPIKWTARSIYLNIVLVALLVPSLVLYGMGGRPTSAAALIWLGIGIVYVASAIKLERLRLLAVPPQAALLCMLTLSVFLIVTLVVFGGFRNFNLDLSRVYDFREEAAAALPGIFEYISSSFSKFVIPFGIVIAMYYRQYSVVAVFSVISFLMFGFTSHKTMLFTPFIVIAAYLLMSYRPRIDLMVGAVVLMVAVIFVGLTINQGAGITSFWGTLENLFVRRTMFVPTMLDYSYIDIFTSADRYYWSTSRLSLGYLEVPNNGLAPPQLVGTIHFNDASAWANTGFIGSGFAQAGVVGLVIYAVLVGLTIAYFEAQSRVLGIPLVTAGTIGLFLAMVQGADFVALFLTHGLLLALLVLAFVRPESEVPGRMASLRMGGRARRFDRPTGRRTAG